MLWGGTQVGRAEVVTNHLDIIQYIEKECNGRSHYREGIIIMVPTMDRKYRYTATETN